MSGMGWQHGLVVATLAYLAFLRVACRIYSFFRNLRCQ